MSDLNRRIAELRGWTDITLQDLTYLGIESIHRGTSPDGTRFVLPDYEHDWAACGPLAEELVSGTGFLQIQIGRFSHEASFMAIGGLGSGDAHPDRKSVV